MIKKIFLLTLLFFAGIPSFASQSSDYLSQKYSADNPLPVKIKCKSEFSDKLGQKIDGIYISFYTYGQGTMKIKKFKKQKVDYICLFDCDEKPVWGTVILSD